CGHAAWCARHTPRNARENGHLGGHGAPGTTARWEACAMSLPIAITDILHGHAVEWERLEFKESWNPLKVLHTLCASANDFHNLGGGYIVIGVAEKNGRPVLPPVGITQEEADRIQKELQNLGHSAIFP